MNSALANASLSPLGDHLNVSRPAALSISLASITDPSPFFEHRLRCRRSTLVFRIRVIMRIYWLLCGRFIVATSSVLQQCANQIKTSSKWPLPSSSRRFSSGCKHLRTRVQARDCQAHERCMARRGKQKLLTEVPQKFDPDFIDRLNQNYRLANIVHDRREALIAHCGGNPSYTQTGQIKRLIWLELITESIEQRFANGETVDIGALTQLNNSIKGIYKDLGLRATPKPVKRLHEHLAAVS